MAMTLKEVIDALGKLEDALPQMLDEYSDESFWSAFAGEADAIVDRAPEHAAFVQERLNCMLGAAGLVPSDNEGEDCVP